MNTTVNPLPESENSSKKLPAHEKGLWAEDVCRSDLNKKGRKILWQRKKVIGIEVDLFCSFGQSFEIYEIKTAGPIGFRKTRIKDFQLRRLFRVKSYLQKVRGSPVKLFFAFVKDQGHISYLPFSSIQFLK